MDELLEIIGSLSISESPAGEYKMDPVNSQVLLDTAIELSISESPAGEYKMDPVNSQVLLDTAIERAVQRTKLDFEATIRDLTASINNLEQTSAVEEYKEIQITPGVQYH